VVTAVIVAHDGAAWLPHLMEALNEQTKPVQRVVAVDTGSRDRSGSVLAALVGQSAVFGMDRSTGYSAAVRRAVAHKAASGPVPGQSGRGHADQVEWLWLLHDDCEPAADALEQLLRGATETPTAAVLGPKLIDWADRDVIVEAGLSIDTAGRRITGIEPREVDQGQHDGDRDALAVSSAGMLVRRDVWEQVSGFDPGMALFGEDIDFCWRVHAAGYRVRVITDAVVFHASAAARGRRAISVGRRMRLLERRNALVTLLGNLPFGAMLISLVGNLMLSFARTLFYLVAKRPAAALDESAAVLGVVAHPLKLGNARRRRARGRRAAYSRLRADLPAGRSIRRVAEFVALVVSRPAPEDLAGAHHASDDPTDDDSLLVDTGLLQRLLTRPGVLLVLALIVVAGVAERSVLTSGTLGGGALLPVWEGASGLWSEFARAYHPTGIGSASAGPPYVGVLALLSTILLGKAWLAIDVLLLGCVPLAGVTAFLALRRVTKSVAVRVWAAASYALLPIAFGAISAGRLGSAVAFVLIPLIGLLAGRMFSQPPKLARRAAWATGLTVTVAAAFVPLLWPMAVVGALVAGLGLRRQARTLVKDLAIVVLTPLILLLPWLLPLLEHPSGLLLEAGIQQPGLGSASLPARSLLLLSPGGPGLPPYWVSGALLLAGLAALLAARRRPLIVSGWLVAVAGLAVGLLASRVTVTPAGGQPVAAWAGVPLAVAAAGLLLAAAAAADGLGQFLSAGGRTGARRLASARAVPVAVLALAACTAPVLAASYWIMNGVSGPLGPAAGQVVPSLVSSTGGAGRQLRTLVLTSAGGRVSFLLLRGGSPQFADPEMTPPPAAQAALAKAVAALVAPGGGEAVNQSQLLARFDIGFVLMRAPIDSGLASVLNGVPGLTGVSMSTTGQFDLWRLTDLPSRVSVLEPNGTVVPVSSGPVGVAGAKIPAAGGTLLLAEPAGNWSASVSGHALSPVASPSGSWAQAFKLPPGGGTLTISRDALLHDLVMALELLAFVVVAALALPGIRTAAEIQAATTAEGSDAGGSQTGEQAEDTGAEREAVLVGVGSRHAATGASQAGQPSPAAPAAGRGGTSGRSRRAGAPNGKRLGRSGRVGRRARTEQPDGADGLRTADDGRSGPGDERRAGQPGRGLSLPTRAGGRLSAGRGRAAAAGAAAAASGGAATELFSPGSGGGRGPVRDGNGGPGYDEPGYREPGYGEPGYGQPAYGDSGYDDRGRGAPGYAQPGYSDRGYRDSGHGRPAAYGDLPRRSAPSPSGTPFDEPYSAGLPGGPGYASEAGYPSEPGYSRASGQDDRRDYGRRDSGRGRASYEDRGSYPEPEDYQGQPGYRDAASARDQAGTWGSDGQDSAWPSAPQQYQQDYQQRGWPQASPQGWPGDSADGADSGWGRSGQQAWPDQPDQLESLPPDEVHHDWPGHDDRPGRGWPAPGRDDEGETW
jgi:GT2 family glycosyltransferase